MKTVDVADLGARIAELIEQLERTPIVIVQGDRPVAALVPVSEEDDLERLALAVSPTLRQILDEAEEEYRRTGGMSHEEFWRTVEERYGTATG
jgi:prevent-host-death family protein